jgi:ubiquinone/menaquinone biosynthesis C-methylase UbiE
MVVLVVGAEDATVREALDRAGADGSVVVVDPSPARLARLEQQCRDARVWYLIGSGDVIPLPDCSVDAVLGQTPEDESARVLGRAA